jgi:N-acyl-L-homoserine lactone synthetase
MQKEILRCVTRRLSIDDPLRASYGLFRKQLFVDKLGWTLSTAGGMEFDEFDTNETIYTLLVGTSGIIGGFRAIRCDNPYLASAVFPQLAEWRDYPTTPDCWEISRFGVMCDEAPGFVAQAAYSAMFRFALRRQARALVALADPTYERYLATLGIKTLRYGPPTVIGHDAHGRPLEALAGEIPLTGQASPRFLNLLKIANAMEHVDETLVLGSDAIPA